MTEKVHIFDTTLRDGEQSPGCSMTVEEKLRLACQLSDLNVDILEAGFPIASSGDFESVRAVSSVIDSCTVAALARSCRQDIEAAAKALEPAKKPRIHTFIATSDIHLQYKLRKTRPQVLEEAVASVELARSYVDDVEWSAEDATRTDLDYLEQVCRAVAEAGATTINLPDTVGYSIPSEYYELIRRFAKSLGPEVIVSVHCHDDLGLATANSLAGVEAGARQIECTVNGIGERAGNCALEEVVMALKIRLGRLPFDTDVVTEQLYPSSQLLSQMISFGPQPNKAIVGANAFAHEAGIHQDGFLKERTTYEIMDPVTVGVPESKLILGKHSGRHALSKRSQELGFSLSRDQIQQLYDCFLELADRQKGVTNEEIAALIETVLAPAPQGEVRRAISV
ncbi:MAG: 2-isopropylmalate synthase [Acidobacteriota bacterium]